MSVTSFLPYLLFYLSHNSSSAIKTQTNNISDISYKSVVYVSLQKEKRQVEESLNEVKEQEEEMSRANRALTTRLEDVQVGHVSYNIIHCQFTSC